MVLLDTLKASQRLRSAGFSDQQAAELVATFAEDFGENLATKEDIALVRKDIESLRAEVGKDIEGVQKDVESLREEVGELRKESRQSSHRIYAAIGGAVALILAGLGIFATVIINAVG